VNVGAGGFYQKGMVKSIQF